MAARGAHEGWKGRPVVAGLVRLAYVVGPLTASFAASWLVTRLPLVAGWDVALRLVTVLAVATVALVAAHRALRRLLPLAALLEMSVAFPGDAPSRFAVARDAGNTEKLRDIVLRAQRGETVVGDSSIDAAREILALVAALRAHDARTRGHSERVRVFTDLIAEQLHLRPEDRERLRWAALLHDVGKIEVPASILNKPGGLSPAEWTSVRAHPTAGVRLIAPIAGWLGEWVGAVGEHHEKWDGTGYPLGLSGQRITLGGRILAVSDAFEVMTAPRSYKRPMSREKALRELGECAGTHFDPVVVRAMLSVSVPRLRLAMGPLAWLASGPLALVTPSATVVVQAGAAVAVAAAPVSLAVASAPDPFVAPPAAVSVVPATLGSGSAGAGSSGAGSSGSGTSGASAGGPSSIALPPPSASASTSPTPTGAVPSGAAGPPGPTATDVPVPTDLPSPSGGRPTTSPDPSPSAAPSGGPSTTPAPSPSASSSGNGKGNAGGNGKGKGNGKSPTPTPSPTAAVVV